MMKYKDNILRIIIIASYIMIIALVISGISALFGYLNTGADRSSILHTELKKIEQYSPQIKWSPLLNDGRFMDQETLKNIEDDYLDAWYVKHISALTNTKEGIKDFYTDNARLNLYDFIETNKKENITIEATTLAHNPTLEFFSEDGQLAVITDHNVKEYKRIYKDQKFLLEVNEISTYKVILLLEDGFWRIRHFVKEKSDFNYDEKPNFSVNNLNIKGVNYYPKDSPWNMFGDSFSEDIIYNDFKIIKEAGLNSVRIFVQYQDFGKADVDSNKLDKLIKTLDAAEANNIKVVITLFDFYGDYSVLDWTLNMKHAETIVTQLKDHKAIIAWDVKNEPNLDFESRGKQKVISWLNNMIDHIKSIDDSHPVTIGWSDGKSAIILKEKVDFISFHYYEDINLLGSTLDKLRTRITDKPIVLGEFGMSSYNGFWKPFGSSEEDQANYYKKAQEIISNKNLDFMSWTLYDFEEIPKEVVGRLPWRKNAQKHFGFIDKNGIKKESFKYISEQ